MQDATWNSGAVVNGVLYGRAKHLFLAQGSHSVGDYATGVRRLSAQSIDTFHKNIALRYRFCKDSNILFSHVIMPDKHSVETEDFPVEGIRSVADDLRGSVGDVGGCVLYGADILRQSTDVYKRTDTHLTDKGTIATACYLTEKVMNAEAESIREKFAQRLTQHREWAGDLGSKLDPVLSSVEIFFEDNKSVHWLHNGLSGANNGIVDIYISKAPVYKRRVMFFGDSFGRDICRFLGQIFSEVVFVRTPFFHEEAVMMFYPDVVITENVERYLDSCQDDALRKPFFMLPYLGSGDFRPSDEFVTAFSSLFSYPRSPYREYMRSLLQPKSV